MTPAHMGIAAGASQQQQHGAPEQRLAHNSPPPPPSGSGAHERELSRGAGVEAQLQEAAKSGLAHHASARLVGGGGGGGVESGSNGTGTKISEYQAMVA